MGQKPKPLWRRPEGWGGSTSGGKEADGEIIGGHGILAGSPGATGTYKEVMAGQAG